MIAAVAEVDGLTDDEPDDQAKPRIKGEAGHQQQRNGDACQRNEGNSGCSERPLEIRTLMSLNRLSTSRKRFGTGQVNVVSMTVLSPASVPALINRALDIISGART